MDPIQAGFPVEVRLKRDNVRPGLLRHRGDVSAIRERELSIELSVLDYDPIQGILIYED